MPGEAAARAARSKQKHAVRRGFTGLSGLRSPSVLLGRKLEWRGERGLGGGRPRGVTRGLGVWRSATAAPAAAAVRPPGRRSRLRGVPPRAARWAAAEGAAGARSPAARSSGARGAPRAMSARPTRSAARARRRSAVPPARPTTTTTSAVRSQGVDASPWAGAPAGFAGPGAAGSPPEDARRGSAAGRRAEGCVVCCDGAGGASRLEAAAAVRVSGSCERPPPWPGSMAARAPSSPEGAASRPSRRRRWVGTLRGSVSSAITTRGSSCGASGTCGLAHDDVARVPARHVHATRP